MLLLSYKLCYIICITCLPALFKAIPNGIHTYTYASITLRSAVIYSLKARIILLQVGFVIVLKYSKWHKYYFYTTVTIHPLPLNICLIKRDVSIVLRLRLVDCVRPVQDYTKKTIKLLKTCLIA